MRLIILYRRRETSQSDTEFELLPPSSKSINCLTSWLKSGPSNGQDPGTDNGKGWWGGGQKCPVASPGQWTTPRRQTVPSSPTWIIKTAHTVSDNWKKTPNSTRSGRAGVSALGTQLVGQRPEDNYFQHLFYIHQAVVFPTAYHQPPNTLASAWPQSRTPCVFSYGLCMRSVVIPWCSTYCMKGA